MMILFRPIDRSGLIKGLGNKIFFMQERAVETRHSLLAAARIEFAEKGFHGARIDKIADAAGINKQHSC